MKYCFISNIFGQKYLCTLCKINWSTLLNMRPSSESSSFFWSRSNQSGISEFSEIELCTSELDIGRSELSNCLDFLPRDNSLEAMKYKRKWTVFQWGSSIISSRKSLSKKNTTNPSSWDTWFIFVHWALPSKWLFRYNLKFKHRWSILQAGQVLSRVISLSG